MLDYEIKLDAFEGPLDLLMHLIEKNKIDIYDIPIAVLTEQYMEYLDRFQEFNIEIASEFLVMAATLLQIKSRILLPKIKKIEDEAETDDELDPRQELIDRLLEYRRFKEVSEILDQLAEEQDKLFFRSPTLMPVQYMPPANLDIQLLLAAFHSVLEANIDHTSLVSREKFSVQDKMADIIFLLDKQAGTILFTDAFTRSGTRNEFITTFLALLELMKLKAVTIKQSQPFSPIYINRRSEE